jgi:hypothetical protein
MRNLFIVFISFMLIACTPDPELKEIQPLLKEESIRLLSQIDPTNGTSLAGLIETYNFKKKHSYNAHGDYVIQVSYRVRLVKSADQMDALQKQAAKLSFGTTRMGAVKEIRSQEFRLTHSDGQWKIYRRDNH